VIAATVIIGFGYLFAMQAWQARIAIDREIVRLFGHAHRVYPPAKPMQVKPGRFNIGRPAATNHRRHQ
jgi:hypothetical protein